MNAKKQQIIARWMTDNLKTYVTDGEEVNCTLMAEHAAVEFDIEDDEEFEELFELAFDVSHEEGYA